MLGLYLVVAHLLGDFVLQTRWQAATKRASAAARSRHVAGYCVPFVPIAVAYTSGPAAAAGFLGLLFVAHWLTDSRRFRSTLGDVAAWRTLTLVGRIDGDSCPDNPWPPTSFLVDQTLHLAQLAVLGAVFLR